MIKVLVVDDLFFMRTLISDLLNSDPEIRVIGTAKDGKDALAKIPRLRPDVITLDLSMPEMDGLTALQEIMNRYPTPVVILSAHESRKEADIVLKCLNSGAVSFVFKPSKELSLDIEDVKHQLLQEIKAVAAVDVKSIMRRVLPLCKGELEGVDALPSPALPYKGREHVEQRIVVIGASTGGPQTLEAVLSALPRIFPATVIVAQHVPGLFFSQSLAKRLNSHCHLDVKVAEDGEIIQTGEVYLIPFGFRMSAPSPLGGEGRGEGENIVHPHPNPPPSRGRELHRGKNAHDERRFALHHSSLDETPSIDETMSSLSRIYRKNVLGIILTGIGSDGVEGMKAIKQNGGRTIAQDGSALINGMPLAVIEAGLADEVLSLEEISEAIVKFVEFPSPL